MDFSWVLVVSTCTVGPGIDCKLYAFGDLGTLSLLLSPGSFGVYFNITSNWGWVLRCVCTEMTGSRLLSSSCTGGGVGDFVLAFGFVYMYLVDGRIWNLMVPAYTYGQHETRANARYYQTRPGPATRARLPLCWMIRSYANFVPTPGRVINELRQRFAHKSLRSRGENCRLLRG